MIACAAIAESCGGCTEWFTCLPRGLYRGLKLEWAKLSPLHPAVLDLPHVNAAPRTPSFALLCATQIEWMPDLLYAAPSHFPSLVPYAHHPFHCCPLSRISFSVTHSLDIPSWLSYPYLFPARCQSCDSFSATVLQLLLLLYFPVFYVDCIVRDLWILEYALLVVLNMWPVTAVIIGFLLPHSHADLPVF